MNEIQLKYGCNPNQKPSRIFMEDGSDLRSCGAALRLKGISGHAADQSFCDCPLHDVIRPAGDRCRVAVC